MTEAECQRELFPVLAGLWKGLVARTPKNADDFDIKAARESNRVIFSILGRFELQAVIDAAREEKRESPSLPPKASYGWLLSKIRSRLQPDNRTITRDPASWSTEDENNLRLIVREYVAAGVQYNETDIAREVLGKNPTAEERQAAGAWIDKQIEEMKLRMRERKPRSDDELNKMIGAWYCQTGSWAKTEPNRPTAPIEVVDDDTVPI